jgi:excisionase family DNA binding protein
MTDDIMLTKKQVAERLNISLWATEQLINKGDLPVVPVGSRVRISPADLDAYVSGNAHRKNQAAPDQDVIVISAYSESSV